MSVAISQAEHASARSHGDRLALRAGARFVTIDGLRGVAALAVVFYHFFEAINRSAPGWAPTYVAGVFQRGYLGVDIFFVLSGFVIAYSVRQGEHTLGYLGRFMARRSLRLDPPYWCAIILEVSLVFVGMRLFPSLSTPLPTPRQLVAHLFYAQNILGFQNILSIFWTLCYEVQFYIFFVSTLVLWRWLPLRGSRSRRIAAYGFFATVFVASLVIRFAFRSNPLHGIAIDRWFQFFLGTLVCWTLLGRVRPHALVAGWASVIGVILLGHAGAEQYVAVGGSMFIYVCGVRGKLSSALGNPALQLLGKISYSLYLFHLPIGWRLISVVEKLIGAPLGPWLAWLLYLVATGVSVAAAWVFWRVVEVPSLQLSKRIRLPSGRSLTPPVVVAQELPANAGVAG